MTEFDGLLVKVSGDATAFTRAMARGFGLAIEDIEPILEVPPQPAAGKGFAPQPASTWFRVKTERGVENPWDAAHAQLAPGSPFAAVPASDIQAIEPDIEQDWPFQRRLAEDHGVRFAAGKEELCTFEDQDGDGGKATGPRPAWNLSDEFSGLAKARAKVGTKHERIIIAHLDTGYDPTHVTLPVNLRKDLQRNFVGGPPNDATDRTPSGMEFMRNRGHGSGTLSLLAGNKLPPSPGWPDFRDFIGGAPLAQIIPVRIANWVVRLTTSTMVQGFGYAREHGAHVLSMSMGGLSSQALADAVNLAYEAGMVVVTAAGNNFAGVPTPKSIVFPARLRRVLAACGVMADGRPYARLRFGTMQGNYGPPSKMDTALGAYTPNVPWAQIDCEKIVDMDGAGTSAATPQIAAAVALWLGEHWDTVSQYSEPWMRVEAVREALFEAALKSTPKMGPTETHQKIGQGVMRVNPALSVQPKPESELNKLPPAEASWSWLNMIVGGGVSLAPGVASRRQAMLMLELTQMAQQQQKVEDAIDDPDRPAEQISAVARRRYLEAALDTGNPSKPLRALLQSLLGQEAAPPPSPPPPRPGRPGATTPPTPAAVSSPRKPPIARKVKEPPMPPRRLRVYALDPSIAKSLASVQINETTLNVPWDDVPADSMSKKPRANSRRKATFQEPLRPGPVGEYLEVIDIDPASNKVYDPVDLNNKELLAQDGWPPSEGNPQFHQQMVYAVAMTTIQHFEQALGRKALWAPHRVENPDSKGWPTEHEVTRLRIYPHALRTANAYYSPDKKALLFGYFPAVSDTTGATAPASMVFACLSSDIIAHEMSHALLDGLHRRFQEASNPDVPAFHEGFADIVALFQHYTLTDLVRFEIARKRGRLSALALLGGLAQQFGEATRQRGPLRDYLRPDLPSYTTTKEVHERGSILVSAIYNAFLSIVDRRTEDLVRLATGGSGILPEGQLHPDLVNLLTTEACKAARHVLQICIRALDYCPAVDITFGEYLRALITADRDLVPKDRYNYRIAFMEAFRKCGILLPRDVRTVSEETLAWNTLEEPSPSWLKDISKVIDLAADRVLTRSEIYQLEQSNRKKLWKALNDVFEEDSNRCSQFGLQLDVPHYDQQGQSLGPPKHGPTTFDVFSVRTARRFAPDGTSHTEVIATIHQRQPAAIDGKDISNGFFWFRGGATFILDPREGHQEIRYVIVKNSQSAARLERQRQAAQGVFLSPLRALYFGETAGEPFAMLHAAYNAGEDVDGS
jgi:subtilisin family serine protease